MTSKLSTQGRLTLPKAIRAALHLRVGDQVDFVFNAQGDVVLRRVEPPPRAETGRPDRFDAVLGSATRKGRTDELMKLLRIEQFRLPAHRGSSTPTRDVVLGKQQQSMIEGQVQSGRHQNASEGLRDGLPMLGARERAEVAKLEALRQAARLG